MANKASKSKGPAAKTAPKTASATKVTRISATDDKKSVKKSPAVQKTLQAKAKKAAKAPAEKKETANPFLKALFGIGGYFKGAWAELRMVRWPTRRATWGLTFAVILFSAFFVVVILLLDILFKYVFELILQ
jgi:preprotein translocase SecE subunit